MKRLIGIVVLLVVLVACSPDTRKIDVRNPATLRDDIFSVEPRVNGTYTIWLVHDDVAAYCTSNKDMGETALRAVHGKSATVVISYINIVSGDPEYSGDTACRAEGAKWILKVLSIEVLGQQP